MKPDRRPALAVVLVVVTVMAMPAPAIGVPTDAGSGAPSGGPLAAVDEPAATGPSPADATAVRGSGAATADATIPVGGSPVARERVGASRAGPSTNTVVRSGGNVTYRLDSSAEWETGTFSNTSAAGGDLGLVPAPTLAWTDTTTDDAMMVDVNDAYNDTHLVYSVDADAVYMANQTTGSVLWSSAESPTNLADLAKIGPRFAYAGDDSNIWVYAHNGTLVHNPTDGDVTSSFIETAAPDNDPNGVFYIGDEDDSVEVFGKDNGSKIRDLTYSGDDGSVLFVDPTGNYLYVQGSGELFVFSGIPSGLTQEASFSADTGGIDEYDSDAVYADGQYLYFGSNGGTVRVVEKSNWSVRSNNISVTGADVWSVDSDDRHVYYAAHDGFVYVHRKDPEDGFPLVARVDVGGGSWANSVDGDGERVFYGTDGGEVGSLTKYTRNGTYTNTRSFSEPVNFSSVSVNASLTASAELVVSSDVDGDGTFENSQTVALADGNNTYDLTGLGNGTGVRVTLRLDAAPNRTTSEVHDLRVNARLLEFFNVSIQGTNAPVVEGETLNVTATVTNSGASRATQTLNLTTRPLNGPEVERATRNVTVGAGETKTVNISWTPGPADAGDYTATVASANDSDVTTVSVREPPYVDVEIAGTDAPVLEGKTLNVNVTLTNRGDLANTRTVVLLANGQQRDSVSVSLAPGESTNRTLSWTTSTDAGGSYVVAVDSADGGDATTVSVKEVRSVSTESDSCRGDAPEGDDANDNGENGGCRDGG